MAKTSSVRAADLPATRARRTGQGGTAVFGLPREVALFPPRGRLLRLWPPPHSEHRAGTPRPHRYGVRANRLKLGGRRVAADPDRRRARRPLSRRSRELPGQAQTGLARGHRRPAGNAANRGLPVGSMMCIPVQGRLQEVSSDPKCRDACPQRSGSRCLAPAIASATAEGGDDGETGGGAACSDGFPRHPARSCNSQPDMRFSGGHSPRPPAAYPKSHESRGQPRERGRSKPRGAQGPPTAPRVSDDLP